MIANILLIILFVCISVWLMHKNIINEDTIRYQIFIDLALWILGLYLGLFICSLIKFT